MIQRTRATWDKATEELLVEGSELKSEKALGLRVCGREFQDVDVELGFSRHDQHFQPSHGNVTSIVDLLYRSQQSAYQEVLGKRGSVTLRCPFSSLQGRPRLFGKLLRVPLFLF